MLGLIASGPALAVAVGGPSGAAFATTAVRTTPPWPERLSITIGCLRISDIRCPTTRAIMSLGPPGGNGTISLIVLLGKSCATARAGHRKTSAIISDLRHFTANLPTIRRERTLAARLSCL